MRRFAFAALLILAAALPAGAAERPDWAFPVTDKVQPPSNDDGKPKTAPGTTRTYTWAQINDRYNPPDWYPDRHPPMPPAVAHGNGGTLWACALCHLPTGTGHDESAYIAGLKATYIIRQMADYKSGARKGSGTMTNMAKAITDDELRAAAAYFASLKPRPWIKVEETDTVPKTYVGPGNKTLRRPDGGTEPLGLRIVEIPVDEQVVLNRDPRKGFVAYVPRGSIAKGKALAATGGDGKTIACAFCHGASLRGQGEAPPLAGRQASYIVRQLWDFQSGDRSGVAAAPMQVLVKNLGTEDMLDLAAYTASLQP